MPVGSVDIMTAEINFHCFVLRAALVVPGKYAEARSASSEKYFSKMTPIIERHMKSQHF